ncbi:MAG: VWA domain-containing protein [Gammaproteobacteria bacterium]|nr:VWA domain-containing protein [Gammaproteobacteria bacterium]
MRQFPGNLRYSAWDGSQQLALDAAEIMSALTDDVIEHGDLRWALRNLMSRGLQGANLTGLNEMLKQLRHKRREQLNRYDLGSLFDDLRKALDEILAMERRRIDEWLTKDGRSDPDEGDGNFSGNVLRSVAERSRQTLDELPEDLAGRISQLEKYEFLDPDAQRKFLELLNRLRQAAANSFLKGMENLIGQLSDGDMDRMKRMLEALNAMLVRRIAGEDPKFDEFMAEFGDLFGDDPPASLDELLEQMRQQMAAAQSLMNSLSAEQRAQLQGLLQNRFDDPELNRELARLMKGLDFLRPQVNSLSAEQRSQLQGLLHNRFDDPELNRELARLMKGLDFLRPQGAQYRFDGDGELSLEAAMQLMNDMQRLDELISQVQSAERGGDLGRIDRDLLEQMAGTEAAEGLDGLNELLKALEEAGYIRAKGGNRFELTPRGSRMIGQKALGEIYQRLKRQSLGNHALAEEGRFGEHLEQTRPLAFGDAFQLHMPRTIRNAIDRNGPGSPVRLSPEDFEVHRSEMITSTSTAMLVDLSWSMALRGSFQAAKKVALALHNLISSRYPRDSFHVIGFAAYAKALKAHELPFLQWDDYLLGTNMQHALLLAARLLGKAPGGAKQIIMISDGEPTAHLQDGQAQFAYPPTPATIRATLRAVRHCTQKGIAINTFMLDRSPYLKAFMDEIARINGGRVFYTSPEQLGEYIVVDYVQHRRTRLGRGRQAS